MGWRFWHEANEEHEGVGCKLEHGDSPFLFGGTIQSQERVLRDEMVCNLVCEEDREEQQWDSWRLYALITK